MAIWKGQIKMQNDGKLFRWGLLPVLCKLHIEDCCQPDAQQFHPTVSGSIVNKFFVGNYLDTFGRIEKAVSQVGVLNEVAFVRNHQSDEVDHEVRQRADFGAE